MQVPYFWYLEATLDAVILFWGFAVQLSKATELNVQELYKLRVAQIQGNKNELLVGHLVYPYLPWKPASWLFSASECFVFLKTSNLVIRPTNTKHLLCARHFTGP